jgi:hypothetical protein
MHRLPISVRSVGLNLVAVLVCAIVSVKFFNADPGLYFDLAGFSFHVPECSTAVAAAAKIASAATSAVITNSIDTTASAPERDAIF